MNKLSIINLYQYMTGLQPGFFMGGAYFKNQDQIINVTHATSEDTRGQSVQPTDY